MLRAASPVVWPRAAPPVVWREQHRQTRRFEHRCQPQQSNLETPIKAGRQITILRCCGAWSWEALHRISDFCTQNENISIFAGTKIRSSCRIGKCLDRPRVGGDWPTLAGEISPPMIAGLPIPHPSARTQCLRSWVELFIRREASKNEEATKGRAWASQRLWDLRVLECVVQAKTYGSRGKVTASDEELRNCESKSSE